MEQAVTTIKTLFRKKSFFYEENQTSQPQLGFKVLLCDNGKQLKVKVIGARQLPVEFGNVKARGYLVKVTFYPSREKYETKIVKESWPIINEEFCCNLSLIGNKKDDFLKGKFISFTVYAILGKECDNTNSGQVKPQNGLLKRYFSFTEGEEAVTRNFNGFKRSGSTRRSSYNPSNSLNNRRTIGAVTYNLEKKNFTQILKNATISTPDIWRNVSEIQTQQSRDGTKGSIELTLQYAVSEDGRNDVVEVTVTKFRCSVQTMQYHERVGGQLYIKITAFEHEDLIQKMKSDNFEPTISLKLEPSASTLRANVNNYNLGQMKILIRLMSKNLVGKKIQLGRIEIDSKSQFWREIVAQPLQSITKMVHFE